MSNHLSTRSAHSQHTSIDHLLSSSIISSFMCPRKRNSTTAEIGSHTGNSNKVPAFHGIICWSAPRQPCKVMVYLASIRKSTISIPFHSCCMLQLWREKLVPATLAAKLLPSGIPSCANGACQKNVEQSNKQQITSTATSTVTVLAGKAGA